MLLGAIEAVMVVVTVAGIVGAVAIVSAVRMASGPQSHCLPRAA